jgi:hypothetical protein
VTVGAAKGEHIGLRCAVDASPPALRFEWEFHGTGDAVDVVPVGREVSQGDLSRFLYSPQTDSEFGTFLCWATNDIGRQVQPCLFSVVAASMLSLSLLHTHLLASPFPHSSYKLSKKNTYDMTKGW